MDSHLVPIKIRVKGSTNQRVKLDGLALNQNGLKSLNA
jgi:hypothetical protein